MRHRTFPVIVVLLLAGLDEPQLAQGLRAAVVLHNRARLPHYLISDAQEVVSQIYSRSGVDLVWFHASRAPSSTPVDDVKSHGRLAYILGHRVLDVSRGYHVQPAIVLAGAIAHEIGHMLLSGGHTSTGLMRARFNQSDFRRIATGELHLTSIEAADMRRAFAKSVIDLSVSADASKR